MKTFGKASFITLGMLFLLCCNNDDFEDQVLDYLDEHAGEDTKSPSKNDIEFLVSSDQREFKKQMPSSNLEESIGVNEKGEVVYKGYFKEGKPEGKWTTFFPDGKPRWEGTKVNGLNHGKYAMWYENGRKKLEGTFMQGEKHGQEISWHLNGMKWHQRNFYHGKPVGLWKSWDASGILLNEINHDSMSEHNQSVK